MGYCRFCGADDFREASYEAREVPSAITIGVTVPQGGGGSLGVTPQSGGTLRYPTRFCKTCREIEANSSTRPRRATCMAHGYSLTVLFPREIAGLLKTLDASHDDVQQFAFDVAKRARRPIKKFLKQGSNPCGGGFAGFPVSVVLCRTKIKVHLLIEKVRKERMKLLIRVSYGGGKAVCR